MKSLAKVAAHFLYACGLVVFMVLSGNKYDWMQEMDPSIGTIPVDESLGDRLIFTFLLLIVIVATQLAIAIKAVHKTERATSIILALVAISVWLLRFRW